MILFLPSYYFCFPTFFPQVKFNTKKLTLSSSLPQQNFSLFFPPFFLDYSLFISPGSAGHSIYPDPTQAALRAALAKLHAADGVTEANIVAGAG